MDVALPGVGGGGVRVGGGWGRWRRGRGRKQAALCVSRYCNPLVDPSLCVSVGVSFTHYVPL